MNDGHERIFFNITFVDFEISSEINFNPTFKDKENELDYSKDYIKCIDLSLPF